MTTKTYGARHAAARKLAIAEGTWRPYVDDAPTVNHLRMLRRAGVSVLAIATTTGLGYATISRLIYPSLRTPNPWGVRPTTERAILAMRVLDTPDRCQIHATGTARRIQALLRLGWRLQDIADRLDVTRSAVHAWTRATRITAVNARRVAAVYDELSMTPGPSRISASRYAHFPPPLAWDDDEIDDPAATPHLDAPAPDPIDVVDDVVIARALAGQPVHVTTFAGRRQLVHVLTAHARTAAEIANLLGITPRTVTRLRSAHPDPNQERAA